MRSITAALVAFSLTVLISAALMLGCGSGGDAVVGNTTSSGNTEYTCNWYNVNGNTDCTSLLTYNSCAEGTYYSTLWCNGRNCKKNCERNVGVATNNQAPVNNTSAVCTNHWNYCTSVTRCCGYCSYDILDVNAQRILNGLSPLNSNSSGLGGGTGMCLPGSGK